MALELNSSKQPFVKINSPKYNLKFPFERNFDLTDLMLFTKGDEPYQHFANLRNNAPVYFHETGPEDSEPGFWVLTKYKDIEFVSKNQEIFSSQLAGGTALTHGFEQQDDLPLYRSTMDHMLSLDGMLHLSMRNPHMAFFNPKYVSNLRKKVELKVDHLLDQIAPLGRCNLVEAVSAEVPMFTLCEMLGVPEEDRPKIIEWMKFLEMAQLIAATQAAEKGDIKFSEEHTQAAPDPALIEMFTNMVAEMFDYGRTILESRRKDPKDDLLSVIANIEVEGEKLPNEYLDGSWLLIIFATVSCDTNNVRVSDSDIESASAWSVNDQPPTFPQCENLKNNEHLVCFKNIIEVEINSFLNDKVFPADTSEFILTLKVDTVGRFSLDDLSALGKLNSTSKDMIKNAVENIPNALPAIKTNVGEFVEVTFNLPFKFNYE